VALNGDGYCVVISGGLDFNEQGASRRAQVEDERSRIGPGANLTVENIRIQNSAED